jgi:hypothetical protein
MKTNLSWKNVAWRAAEALEVAARVGIKVAYGAVVGVGAGVLSACWIMHEATETFTMAQLATTALSLAVLGAVVFLWFAVVDLPHARLIARLRWDERKIVVFHRRSA